MFGRAALGFGRCNALALGPFSGLALLFGEPFRLALCFTLSAQESSPNRLADEGSGPHSQLIIRGVTPQDHEYPPGKKLIGVQVCAARVEVGDEEIALARDALAELAGGRAHGARSTRKRPRRASASSMRSIEFA
jgi:hypothetical protein